MSRHTYTILDDKAKQVILRGVNAIYEPVKRTLGPEGSNSLIYRTMNRGPRINNDGKTLASVQIPKDLFIRQVAETFKEACLKTDIRVGDGTTTTTIIAGKLYKSGHALLSQNTSSLRKDATIGVISLKKKILQTADIVKKEIKKRAKKIKTLEELENLAYISCEDEKIGKMVAKMAWEVGVDGFIDTFEGYHGVVETELLKGNRFPAKVPDKRFLTNPEAFEQRAIDSKIILTNFEPGVKDGSGFKRLSDQKFVEQLIPLLEKNKKIVIIAPHFSKSVLAEIVKANVQLVKAPDGSTQAASTGIQLLPVKVPSLRTEQFEDLAVYFGAKFINKADPKAEFIVKEDDLGFVENLIVKDEEVREDAIATGGKGTKKKGDAISPVEERINILKGQLKETKQVQFKELMKRRIASLSTGVGKIRVGAATDAESLWKKLKIEDTVNACKSALRGGYVKGGGMCLKEIADTLPDDDVFKEALAEPYEIIKASLGGKLEITDNIIDSAESVYYAIEYASEVSAQLLTCDIITVESEETPYADGEKMIANQIGKVAGAMMKHYGLEQEAMRDMEYDEYGGMTEEEFIYTNKD